MSSQLASIVPHAPLTDSVFPFNQHAFVEIRRFQEEDLQFLESPVVKGLFGVGDAVGGTATAVTAGVGKVALGTATSMFKGIGKVTQKLPGGDLLHQAGQGILGGISKTEQVAEKLVDPTRVTRDHYHYSNEVKDSLPGVIDTVDQFIHDFSYDTGNMVKDLYENIPTKGVQIVTGLIKRLEEVDNSLSKLHETLTKNNIQENLKVGHDKHKSINHLRHKKNYLAELSECLPPILKTILEVKGAFAAILANFKLALDKINSGITDPKQIFVENYGEVVAGWQAFQDRRKTMTYLPYKY